MTEDKEIEDNNLKRMVVFGGDGDAGKTSMSILHMTGQPPKQYIPTKFDIHDEEYSINGKIITVTFNDHEGGGGEDWPRLRPLGYIGADCVVLCFSIGSREGFMRIRKYWFPFTRKYCPEAKLILVGTKRDLRDDKDVNIGENNEQLVTYAEGDELSKKIKAECYMECSTLRGEGIEDVFRRAAELSSEVVIDPDSRKKILESIRPYNRVNCSVL